MDHTPRKKHDAQRLANFIENVRYYCEYNSKRMPDEKFIIDNWKKEIPLDELVEKYESGGLGTWSRKGKK
jgi:hypothetical protein